MTVHFENKQKIIICVKPNSDSKIDELQMKLYSVMRPEFKVNAEIDKRQNLKSIVKNFSIHRSLNLGAFQRSSALFCIF